MNDESEISMRLKTYTVSISVVTLEDENAEGDSIIKDFIQSEIQKKISEEHMFDDKNGGVVFFFGSSVKSVKMIRSVSAFK